MIFVENMMHLYLFLLPITDEDHIYLIKLHLLCHFCGSLVCSLLIIRIDLDVREQMGKVR